MRKQDIDIFKICYQVLKKVKLCFAENNKKTLAKGFQEVWNRVFEVYQRDKGGNERIFMIKWCFYELAIFGGGQGPVILKIKNNRF